MHLPFPGWEALDAEKQEEKAQIWLVIKDNDGEVVVRLEAPAGKGLHRTNWDLRYASTNSRRPSGGPQLHLRREYMTWNCR